MRVLLTNEYGDKDVMEAIDVFFDEGDNQLNILCIDEITSYKIKADEDNEAVLRDAINTLLIKGYVDLSAYKAQDYDDDDEDCEEDGIDISEQDDSEYDDEDNEEDISQYDSRASLYESLRSDTSEKKKGFFSRFIE